MNFTTYNIQPLLDVATLAIVALIFSFCYTIELTLLDIKKKIEKLSPTTKEMTERGSPTIYYESDKDSVSIVSDSDYEPDDEYSDEEEEDEISSDEEDECDYSDEEDEDEKILKKKTKNMFSCIDYIQKRDKQGVIDYVKNFGTTVLVKGTTKKDRNWVYSELDKTINAYWKDDSWYLDTFLNGDIVNLVRTYDVDEQASVFDKLPDKTIEVSIEVPEVPEVPEVSAKEPEVFISTIYPPPEKKTKIDTTDDTLIDNIWQKTPTSDNNPVLAS
tara:strand:- start:3202 stop:4020 length:819 start_codon:yes stop_codon:yes gene_type:complete